MRTFIKNGIIVVAVLSALTLTACSSPAQQPAEDVTVAPGFTPKPISGDKVDITGLKLTGNEAHQKLLEVLEYAAKTANTQGVTEDGTDGTKKNVIIYTPGATAPVIYDAASDSYGVLDSKTYLTVYGFKGYVGKDPKSTYELKNNTFTITSSDGSSKYTLVVADGLPTKYVEELKGKPTFTTAISFGGFSDAVKTKIEAAIKSASHSHDANGNDVAAQ